jgi:hypothetical protein
VKELEKGSDKDAVQREKTLRSKISDIIPCDLTLDYPLLKVYPPFDVLSINFCVEVVATDIKKFTEYLKVLRSLLKNEGYVGIFVSLQESFYIVNGGKRYNHLFLTSEDVKKAFSESGFEILRVRHLDIPLKSQIPTFNDCKSLGHFVAKKLV